MTPGERQLKNALVLIALIYAATFAFGLILSVALYGLNWLVRLTTTGHLRRIDRLGISGYTLVIGLVFGTFLTLSSAKDYGQKNGWRRLVPAFLWPEHSKESPSALVRLGRVGHWIFVVCAVASLIGGLYAVVDNQTSITTRRAELAEWDRTHAIPGQPGMVYTEAPSPTGGTDYRPYVPDESYAGLWIGLAVAAASALIGRAFRYILAGE